MEDKKTKIQVRKEEKDKEGEKQNKTQQSKGKKSRILRSCGAFRVRT